MNSVIQTGQEYLKTQL